MFPLPNEYNYSFQINFLLEIFWFIFIIGPNVFLLNKCSDATVFYPLALSSKTRFGAWDEHSDMLRSVHEWFVEMQLQINTLFATGVFILFCFYLKNKPGKKRRKTQQRNPTGRHIPSRRISPWVCYFWFAIFFHIKNIKSLPLWF